MNITVAFQDGEKRHSVTLDPNHRRVLSGNEKALDEVADKVDWELSGQKDVFQGHVRQILREAGFSDAE